MRNAVTCFVAVLGLIVPLAGAEIIYIDDDAPAGGNGQSWTTAFTFLQDALAAVQPGDEIRVAGGVYYPDRNAAQPTGTGDRDASFNLVSGVAIYGGYAGLSLPSDPDERDLQLYATTLSGNINSPDDPWDNSRHVVMATGTAPATLLDGLTITAGSGRYEIYQPPTSGMGLYVSNAVLTMRDCTITNNLGGSNPGWGPAGNGAGMYCELSSVDLIRCTVSNNVAGAGFDGYIFRLGMGDDWVQDGLDLPADGGPGGDGGGIYATNNSVIRAISCTLVDNRAGDGGYASHPNIGGRGGQGGAVWLGTSSHLEACNCLIGGNRAGGGGDTWLGSGGYGGHGAGIYVGGSSGVYAVNCRISGNRCGDGGGSSWGAAGAGGGGAGIYIDTSGCGEAVHCLISGNRAGDGNDARYGGDGGWGGGLLTKSQNVRLVGCTITRNDAGQAGTGADVNGQPGHGGALYCDNAVPVVTNCVVRLGAPDLIIGLPEFAYSNVEGGWTGIGNISADPLFVDPDGPDNDPNTWADNNFRLAAGSPCIDAGSNVDPPRDVFDLDGDGCVTEPLPLDLDGYARYVDDPNTPDTGCGSAPLVDMGAYEYGAAAATPGGPCAGDLNCDGIINFTDINAFVLAQSDPAAYQAAFPNCFHAAGDCNDDGIVNFDDIDPFVALLSGD